MQANHSHAINYTRDYPRSRGQRCAVKNGQGLFGRSNSLTAVTVVSTARTNWSDHRPLDYTVGIGGVIDMNIHDNHVHMQLLVMACL